MKITTRQLTLTGVFTALVCVSTIVIQIPLPLAQGYFNFGDFVIFMSAFLLSPPIALIVGGLGSAFADLLLGFHIWAIPTLIIKGIEGGIAGIFMQKSRSLEKNKKKKLIILGLILAIIEMGVGYTLATYVLFQSWETAIISAPSYFLQSALSGVIAMVFIAILKFDNNGGVFKLK